MRKLKNLIDLSFGDNPRTLTGFPGVKRPISFGEVEEEEEEEYTGIHKTQIVEGGYYQWRTRYSFDEIEYLMSLHEDQTATMEINDITAKNCQAASGCTVMTAVRNNKKFFSIMMDGGNYFSGDVELFVDVMFAELEDPSEISREDMLNTLKRLIDHWSGTGEYIDVEQYTMPIENLTRVGTTEDIEVLTTYLGKGVFKVYNGNGPRISGNYVIIDKANFSFNYFTGQKMDGDFIADIIGGQVLLTKQDSTQFKLYRTLRDDLKETYFINGYMTITPQNQLYSHIIETTDDYYTLQFNFDEFIDFQLQMTGVNLEFTSLEGSPYILSAH